MLSGYQIKLLKDLHEELNKFTDYSLEVNKALIASTKILVEILNEERKIIKNSGEDTNKSSGVIN